MKKEYFTQMSLSAATIAVLLIVPELLLWLFGINTSDVRGWAWITTVYLTAVTVFCFVAFGTKARAIKDPDGVNGYSYGAAFSFAILSALLSSVLSSALRWIFITHIAPEIGQFALGEIHRSASGMPTKEMAEMMIKMGRFMLSYWGLLIISILNMLLWGGFVALFTSVYLKRNVQI